MATVSTSRRSSVPLSKYRSFDCLILLPLALACPCIIPVSAAPQSDPFMADWVGKLCATRPALPATSAAFEATAAPLVAAKPGEWDLVLVNYRSEPVRAAAVPLESATVRAVSAVADGAIEAVTREGIVVPLLPARDGKTVVAHVPFVAAGGAMFLKLRLRAGGWPDLLRESDAGGAERRVANGLVVCESGKGGLAIGLGDSSSKDRRMLERLTFGGTLVAGTRKPVPFRLPGLRGGRERVERHQDVIRYTREHEDVADSGAELSVSVSLAPGRMAADYTVRIKNSGNTDLIIKEPLVRAFFGELMSRPDKTISQPLRRGESVIEARRPTLRLPVNFSRNAQLTNNFTLGVRDRNGYGLGMVSSEPLDYRPTLRINASEFRLSLLPTPGGKPVRLRPGGVIRTGLTLLFCSPGQDAHEWASRVYASRAGKHRDASDTSAAADSPLAVFLRTGPVLAMPIPGVHESSRSIGRLVATSGTVSCVDGRIRLVKNAEDAELLWSVKLPSGSNPRVGIEGAELSPGARLHVVASDEAGRELVRQPVSGDTPIPLPDREGSLHIALRLSGPPGAYAGMGSISIGEALLPAPALRFPRDRASITDFAFEPLWTPVENAIGHRLQVASDATFGAGTLVVDLPRENPGEPVGQALLPRLAPGDYWWRVRAWQNGPVGAWSRVGQFAVNRDYSARSVTQLINAANPKFIFHGPPELKHAIPDDLRGLVMRRGAPADAMVEDDLDVVATDSNLCALEHWFQTHKRVRGVMICERFWKVYSDDPEQRQFYTRRLRTLLLLCAKYGRVFFWSDGNGNKDHWGPLGADPEWVELFRRYHEHVVLGNKSNVWMAAHSTHSHTQGMWLTGLSSQLMSSLEWWYWRDVGFQEGLDTYAGRDHGVPRYIPPAVYVQQFLVGMCQGAAVYQIGTVHVVGDPKTSPGTVLCTPEGRGTPGFVRHILPFVRFIAGQRPIPSREEVLANLRVAVAIDGALKPEPIRRNLKYGIYEALYRGTYGFDDAPWKHHLDEKRTHNGSHLWEYVPNTGRYGMFPLIPFCVGAESATRALGAKVVTVPLSKLQDVPAVKALFDQHYPPIQSEAFTARWGEQFVVINSHENKDIDQRFIVRFPESPIRALEGSIGVHGSILGRNRAGTMNLHLDSARLERVTVLSLLCAGSKPEVSATPAAVLRRTDWDAVGRRLRVELSHASGAVDLEVRQAGTTGTTD